MKVVRRVNLPAAIQSAAVSPAGDRVIIATEGDRLEVLDGLALESRGALAVPSGIDRLPRGTTCRPVETRLAFLDDRTLLVARADYPGPGPLHRGVAHACRVEPST